MGIWEQCLLCLYGHVTQCRDGRIVAVEFERLWLRLMLNLWLPWDVYLSGSIALDACCPMLCLAADCDCKHPAQNYGDANIVLTDFLPRYSRTSTHP